MRLALRHTSDGPIDQARNHVEELLMMTNMKHIVDLPSTDAEYRFGKPKTYLTVHEVARLTLLRSRLGETQCERASELLPSSASRCNPTGPAMVSERAVD
jgi:hypothetical protein